MVIKPRHPYKLHQDSKITYKVAAIVTQFNDRTLGLPAVKFFPPHFTGTTLGGNPQNTLSLLQCDTAALWLAISKTGGEKASVTLI